MTRYLLVLFFMLTQHTYAQRTGAAFNGDNNQTFSSFNAQSWAALQTQLNEVMKGWESAIAQADEKKLQTWSGTITRICTHNAYHTGQILYVRKQAGNWDAAKGVK